MGPLECLEESWNARLAQKVSQRGSLVLVKTKAMVTTGTSRVVAVSGGELI